MVGLGAGRNVPRAGCERGPRLSPVVLVRVLPEIQEYLSRYLRPDFSDMRLYLQLMGETVAVALWGTGLAFGLAAVLAPLAASNFTPHPVAYIVSRELLNIFRSLPDLVIAFVFVSALKIGPLPGVLALGLHTAGFLGKFVAEALVSSGGRYLQRRMFAGAPSINRQVLGYTLYIFDRNVRMAVVLGIVGAGGIGVLLHHHLRVFSYSSAAAVICIIFATTLLTDYASTWLRKRMT